MRKAALILIACILAASLSGCSQANQVENLAYAVIFGVDLTDDDRIELSIQVPKITGKGDDGGSGGSSESLVYSASGDSFREALKMLEWAVSRRLNLSQIELVVISKELASSRHFPSIADEIMQTRQFYTAARLAISEGSAKEIVEAQDMMIGSRVATDLTAMFEDYTDNAFIPDTTLADVYYKSISICSDPITAFVAHQPAAQSSVQVESAQTIQAFGAIIPREDALENTETQHANHLLGAAVFHNGRLTGQLSAQQLLYTLLLRGRLSSFLYAFNGTTVELTRFIGPTIDFDLNTDPLKLSVNLTLHATPESSTADLTGLEELLSREMTDTVAYCQSLGTEPFEFAEALMGRFPTITAWNNFRWRDRFPSALVSVHVNLRRSGM